MQEDVARIKHQLSPMVQEILRQWLTIHFLCTTTTTPTIQDFSSRISSLHIGNGADRRSVAERLGSFEFTLGCLIDFPSSNEGHNVLCSKSFPKPSRFIDSVQKFSNFIVWGRTSENFPISSSPTIELASLLLRHGQYEPAENLLLIMDAYSSKRKISLRSQDPDSDRCARLHLLGFCFLMRAHNEVHGVLKEKKIHEAVCCFFRAASKQGASQSLQNLSFDTGFKFSGECRSAEEWRLHYYQWAMQIFEQYGMNEGACQFALAALERVDEVLGSSDTYIIDDLPEPATTIRGRLWENVFQFALNL